VSSDTITKKVFIGIKDSVITEDDITKIAFFLNEGSVIMGDTISFRVLVSRKYQEKIQ